MTDDTQMIMQAMNEMMQELKDMRKETNERFEKVNERFDKVEQRLEGIEESIQVLMVSTEKTAIQVVELQNDTINRIGELDRKVDHAQAIHDVDYKRLMLETRRRQ